MPDFRDLCARMADELDYYRQLLMDDRRETHALAVEARAALAEPEPEGPTTQELKTFACEWWNKFGFVKDKATCRWVLDEIDPENFADFARDVLARWGNHPGSPDSSGNLKAGLTGSPATGEVAELAACIREEAWQNKSGGLPIAAAKLARAADLLERLAPQPVPVAERLPGPGDWVWHCYAGVRFWQHGIYNGRQFFVGDGPESQPATHWLPAHALPLPQPH